MHICPEEIMALVTAFAVAGPIARKLFMLLKRYSEVVLFVARKWFVK